MSFPTKPADIACTPNLSADLSGANLSPADLRGTSLADPDVSSRELLRNFAELLREDRACLARILRVMGEIDARKVWAAEAFPSMFAFCVERFHLSESMAAKRIRAARAARRFPLILQLLNDGELTLSAIHRLSKHLTTENHRSVLARARHRRTRRIEELVAEIAPRADVPSRVRALPRRAAETNTAAAANSRSEAGFGPADSESPEGISSRDVRDHGNRCDNYKATKSRVAEMSGRHQNGPLTGGLPRKTASRTTHAKPASKVSPLSPRRYKVEATVDQETHDRLRALQEHLGRHGHAADVADVLQRAVETLLNETLRRKALAPVARRKTTPSSASTSSGNAETSKDDSGAGAAIAPDGTLRKQLRAESRTPGVPSRSVTPGARNRPRTARRLQAARPVTGTRFDRDARKKPRSIPAAVRREVWQRDLGQCTFRSATGRRCGSIRSLEFHHETPFGKGGCHDPANLTLRCQAHNQYQADLDFGQEFMDGRRRG